VVEELLPAFVTGLAEVDADERIVLRLGGFLNKRHSGLLGRAAAFSYVTFGAGTDRISPR